MSADWFLRGALTKIGDTFDRFMGRRWVPSSSLATSELIERTKRLLDSEAKEVPGKGLVVPHNIKLKMQWDKFSTDSEDTLAKLEQELLVAAADHINDSLYYTYAPLSIEVKTDYFTEGVKLFVSFDKFSDDEPEVEMNVTITGVKLGPVAITQLPEAEPSDLSYVAHYTHKGYPREKRLHFAAGRRIAIGRAASNDLVLDDPSVSKIHAALVMDADGHLSVADTGSTNGTFINDERIAYGKASRLVEGDRLKFGTIDVTMEYVGQKAEIAIEPTNESDGQVSIDGFEFNRRETIDILPFSAAQAEEIDDDTARIEDLTETDISDQVTEPNYPKTLNQVTDVNEDEAE